MEIKSFCRRYNKQILFLLILITATLTRTILFASHPGGLNQDEASIGYDAWALLNYGVDRNGSTLPVHLIAWGSGQNVLYAYLSMPFIALFGLNVFSVRAVNLIFSLLTVVAVYFMVKKFKGSKIGFVAMALVAISPWNIMLARWGLESNLFPAMFILSVWAFVEALDNKKFLYLAAVLFALSMYSYGSAYLVVTIFCLISFIYVLIKKLISLKTCILSAVVFLLVSFPIYLFVIVNVFELDTINIGLLTIPHEYGDRLFTQSGVTFSGFFENIKSLIIEQYDSSDRNAFVFYGCLYVISLPFFVYGIVKMIKKHSTFDFIILNMFVCSMLLFLYYQAPNINRVNSVYLPMIIITAVGVGSFIRSKVTFAGVVLAYVICFAGFNVQYFSQDYQNSIKTEFYYSFGDAVNKAEQLSSDDEAIYVTANVNMPYIYVLFYTQTPPQEFYDTVVYSNPGSQFQLVSSFGNYSFSSSYLSTGQQGIYILDNSDIETISQFTDEIYTFDSYSVAVID